MGIYKFDRVKLSFVALFGLVIILIIVLSIHGSPVQVTYTEDRDKALDTANQFLLNIMRNEYAEAYNKQCSTSFKEAVSLDKVKAIVKNDIKTHGAIDRATFDYYLPEPLISYGLDLYYKVHYSKGKTMPFVIALERDKNGDYKIFSYDYVRVDENKNTPKPYCKYSVEITPEGIKKHMKR